MSCQYLLAQQSKDPWEKWNYLIGEWVGENNGQPGQGEGKFSFLTDLNGKILVRKSHTTYPPTANSTGIVHDDILIIYPVGNSAQEAIYFDNEGHTIKYKVSFTDRSIILTSDISPSDARFRFTYSKIDTDTVNASFEIASPQTPDDFKMYLSGKAVKVK
jgi:hypothetical protein